MEEAKSVYNDIPMKNLTVDKTKPVLRFPYNETLQAYLKYWQHVLHLDDWYIKAVLVDELRDKDGDELWGQIIPTVENKEALIKINTADIKNAYMKHCEELTLVHELLHCVIIVLEAVNETIESATFTREEHQKVETLAKAFIMAKYGVDKEWFFKEA